MKKSEPPCAHPDNVSQWFNLHREHASIWCSDCGAMWVKDIGWQIPRLHQEKKEK